MPKDMSYQGDSDLENDESFQIALYNTGWVDTPPGCEDQKISGHKPVPMSKRMRNAVWGCPCPHCWRIPEDLQLRRARRRKRQAEGRMICIDILAGCRGKVRAGASTPGCQMTAGASTLGCQGIMTAGASTPASQGNVTSISQPVARNSLCCMATAWVYYRKLKLARCEYYDKKKMVAVF